MKKHDDGYVLVLVMVVILVLTICATAVLSFSVNNLKSQQRMVDRMQAKYKAQGEIEKIVGQLEKGWVSEPVSKTDTTKDANSMIREWMIAMNIPDAENIQVTIENEKFNFSFNMETQNSSESENVYKISGRFDVCGTITSETNNIKNEITYTINGVSIEYASYEIGGDST